MCQIDARAQVHVSHWRMATGGNFGIGNTAASAAHE
jgi:hypothetical protein